MKRMKNNFGHKFVFIFIDVQMALIPLPRDLKMILKIL